MPTRWRRKYSALFDNVLECGLTDPQLATVVRLQAILHRAWRTDPVRYERWAEGDAERILTESEVCEAAKVMSLSKARAKLLNLSGCDPYLTGALTVERCPGVGAQRAHPGRAPGAQVGARTVRVIWRNFGQILNAHGPRVRSPVGGWRPYEGRRTRNEVPSRPQVPSGGWDQPAGTPRLADLTDEDRRNAREEAEAMKAKIRRDTKDQVDL